MPRKILHLDLDAFYCAVEEQRDPSLVGVPFAVGGRPQERGVVSSCSYAARRLGIRSAMAMAHATRLCPGLRIISPHYKAYARASEGVMEHLRSLTPLVEQISIDEAFLDVSDLSESAETIAFELQATVRDNLILPCSLGVATNKLLAKTANDFGKATAQSEGPPNAITVVHPGDEAAFLAPLPVEALWGVGPKTAERLSALEIYTIGELARCPPAELARLFGKIGHELSLRAKGIDERPIVTHHEPKSFSQEVTFAHDVSDEAHLHRTLHDLSKGTGRRLRKAERAGTTVKLKLRWPDFSTLTRQTTLSRPTDDDDEIYSAALRLFKKVWSQGKAVRLIGVGVSGLAPPARQLSLWEDAPRASEDREDQSQAAVEMVRKRFGDHVLQRGFYPKGRKDR